MVGVIDMVLLFANDIENPAYELFKKVWIMCDKAQQPDDDEISNE